MALEEDPKRNPADTMMRERTTSKAEAVNVLADATHIWRIFILMI
jgi:hypothetical protein